MGILSQKLETVTIFVLATRRHIGEVNKDIANKQKTMRSVDLEVRRHERPDRTICSTSEMLGKLSNLYRLSHD